MVIGQDALDPSCCAPVRGQSVVPRGFLDDCLVGTNDHGRARVHVHGSRYGSFGWAFLLSWHPRFPAWTGGDAPLPGVISSFSFLCP
jgi:hypothetical protein